MSHDFTDDDAVMACSGCVQPVDGIGGNLHGSVIPEGDIRPLDIVVDCLGQMNDIDFPLFMEPQGVFECSASAQTDQAVNMMTFEIFYGHRDHIAIFSTH